MARAPPKTKRRILLVLLFISPWFLNQAWIETSAPDIEIKEMPTCEDGSKNCVHLGGGETFEIWDDMTTQLDSNATTTYLAFKQWVEDADAKLLYEEKNGSWDYYLHVVDLTEFWLYPDDVIIHIVDYEDGCEIELHSESRLGANDFGENLRRVEQIHRALLDAELIWN